MPVNANSSRTDAFGGAGMNKVSEYRQHAKECRVLAHRSRSSQHRDMLLDMAATWESLADDRIKTAGGLKRIAILENADQKAVSVVSTPTPRPAPRGNFAAAPVSRSAGCGLKRRVLYQEY